jgi:hypothetical protein
MRGRTILVVAVLALSCSFPAAAAAPGGYGLSVLVDGSPAPEYPCRGRIYVEALRGKTFTLRLTNPTAERVAVALSVDGRNIVDARRTTELSATKWVLGPGQSVEIPGWQISGETARRFFFTETARSYARWLGDTSNVGTIEAVFFREKRLRVAQPMTLAPEKHAGDAAGPDASSPWERGQAQAGPRDEGSANRQVPSPTSKDSTLADVERRRETDSYAATGIGDRTSFPVTWVDFREDPTPVATVTLRYEFRPELVRLGVLTSDRDLWAREKAQGFERRYAPSPER